MSDTATNQLAMFDAPLPRPRSRRECEALTTQAAQLLSAQRERERVNGVPEPRGGQATGGGK